MKLSFVIPAYNEEHFIGKCLESIARERKGTNFDIEVIVVNNASIDNTHNVAAGFPNVIVVDEPKKGLVAARSAGFHASTGDLIANIDADTMLTDRWIQKVFSEFEKNSSLVALSGPHIHYDAPRFVRFLVALWYRIIFVFYLVMHYVFRISGFLQGGNYIVRRDALIAIGGFNTALEFWGEDADIAIRLNPVGKIKFTLSLPIYASGRRMSGDGVLKTAMRYAVNYFWILLFHRPFNTNYNDYRPTKQKE